MDTSIQTESIYTWIPYRDRMPKWAKDAKEFTVGVSFHKTRGYQLNVPRPVMARLDNPDRVTFVLKQKRIEVRGGDH